MIKEESDHSQMRESNIHTLLSQYAKAEREDAILGLGVEDETDHPSGLILGQRMS
jgi:hypothetical protein